MFYLQINQGSLVIKKQPESEDKSKIALEQLIYDSNFFFEFGV